MSSVWLCGGRIITGDDTERMADLEIGAGRILTLGMAPQDVARVDVSRWVLWPALTDLAARLREPGPREHGDIASETAAAAAAGFAQVVLPADTQPVIDSAAIAHLIRDKAAQAGAVRVLPLGALTQGLEGRALANMAALKGAGCIAVSQARRPMASHETWLRCLQFAAGTGLTVFFSPEDAALAQGCVHDGFMASRLGLPGIPNSAETVAMATQLLLVEQTGVRAHFGQLSTAGSVQLLRWAKAQGLPVSGDVAMHQLHLTDAAIDGFNAFAHVRPPLRAESDRQALLEGVATGVIDAICSDHQPLHSSAKQAPFAATMPGMSTLQTVLPLGLRLVAEGELTLARLIDALALAPRRILGQEARGLAVGAVADIVAIDRDVLWEVDAKHWHSAGRNTLYWGRSLRGCAAQLWIDGRACLSEMASSEV